MEESPRVLMSHHAARSDWQNGIMVERLQYRPIAGKEKGLGTNITVTA